MFEGLEANREQIENCKDRVFFTFSLLFLLTCIIKGTIYYIVKNVFNYKKTLYYKIFSNLIVGGYRFRIFLNHALYFCRYFKFY